MRRQFAILVVTLGLVAACGGSATPTPAPTAAPTPAPTDIFVPTAEPEVTETPEPTPVAGTRYVVKKGDTMWAIALDHGISLADLQAANLDVDPRAMRVGAVLIIPGQ
jgi:2',3'-cyclic-nucleotide 2'-phosphodiesterase/3'-nucleotidase